MLKPVITTLTNTALGDAVALVTDEGGAPVELYVEPTDEELGAYSAEEPLLEEHLASLDVRDYTVEYQWMGRGAQPGTAGFRWLVGEGIAANAALGAQMQDFDNDGDDELLVVRWTDDSRFKIEMVEIEDEALVVVPLEEDLYAEIAQLLGDTECLSPPSGHRLR